LPNAAGLSPRYWSGLLHKTTLAGLTPRQTYYYAIGNAADGPPPSAGATCGAPDALDCGFFGITQPECPVHCCWDAGNAAAPCTFDSAGAVYSFEAAPAAELVEGGFTFAVVGDLGQTHNSLDTLRHMVDAGRHFTVHVGDLSYADCDQPR
jgi:hypothetical protein